MYCVLGIECDLQGHHRKNCPVDLLEGDSGWIPVWCRHQREVFKLWYRLSNMDDSRLTKQIFNWSLALADKGKATWCLHVRKLLSRINLNHLCPSNITIESVAQGISKHNNLKTN